MKVYYIGSRYKDLTINKCYEIETSINRVITLKEGTLDFNKVYFIINDKGVIYWYDKTNFIALKEYRELIVNKILE